MAKGNMLQGMARGSVGDIVFSRAGGQQLSRVRNRAPKNPKTQRQMYQRATFLEPAKFYAKGIQSLFKFAFENKAVKESDYNCFMRMNSARGILMTKQMNDNANYPKIGKFYMTYGNLPMIPTTEVTASELGIPQVQTSITPSVSAISTIKDLSQILMDYSSAIHNDDILTLLVIKTYANGQPNAPFMALVSDDSPEWSISQIRIDNTNENPLPNDLMAGLSTTGYLYLYNSTVTNAGDISLGNICISRVTASGVTVSPSTLALSQKALVAYNRMKPTGDYQTTWAQTVLDSYSASGEAILEGTAVNSSTTQGGLITSVTLNDKPIATGTTATEYGTLAITGTNLTAQTIEVQMNGVSWSPITQTDTEFTYNVSSNGTLTITLNGRQVFTATFSVTTPRPFTRIQIGSSYTNGEPIEDAVIETGIGTMVEVTGTGMSGLVWSINNPKFTLTNQNVTDTSASVSVTTTSPEASAVLSLGDFVVAQISSVGDEVIEDTGQ